MWARSIQLMSFIHRASEGVPNSVRGLSDGSPAWFSRIRLEKSHRKENRRGETISHRGEEGHAGVGQPSGEERTGPTADAGVDRAVAGCGGRTDRRGGTGDDRGPAAAVGGGGRRAAASGEERRGHRLAWEGARHDLPERAETAGEAAALMQERREGRG